MTDGIDVIEGHGALLSQPLGPMIEVLHCRAHDFWALSMGEQRVTPGKCCGKWHVVRSWRLTDMLRKEILDQLGGCAACKDYNRIIDETRAELYEAFRKNERLDHERCRQKLALINNAKGLQRLHALKDKLRVKLEAFRKERDELLAELQSRSTHAPPTSEGEALQRVVEAVEKFHELRELPDATAHDRLDRWNSTTTILEETLEDIERPRRRAVRNAYAIEIGKRPISGEV